MRLRALMLCCFGTICCCLDFEGGDLCPPGSIGLSRNGSTLCWNEEPVRMIGYSAFDVVTRNDFDFRRYMNMLQFVEGSRTVQSHGVNLTRIWAMGWHNAPQDCRTP